MTKLTKAEFMDKLARLPEDKATAEEKAIFENADLERAAGIYGGMELEKFRKKQGRMTLRLPPSLHAELQEQSQHEQMSLNHYIVYSLGRAAENWKAQHN
jgi:hypothetical protein